jgi:tripeptide aminopeptidase
MQHLIDRFVRYVKIDTESDPNSNTTPSTEKQWNMAHLLVQELTEMGLQDISIDEHAYVMATLPSNVDHEVPTIGFISHFDTTPDFTGANIQPQIVPNYDGGDIVLNEEHHIVLSPNYFPDLLQYKGQTLITTNGLTLLGADDKAGITEIMAAMEYLVAHPAIKHGTIRVGFTPDEEIGRGAHKFDVEKFGCDWAYTMDGSQVGELEYENFNAAGAKIVIQGKSVHPGYAKGKLINAMRLAAELVHQIPAQESPEQTSGYEGFYHITGLEGQLEEMTVSLIIRDHDKALFEQRKEFISSLVAQLNNQYEQAFGGPIATLTMNDQYYNMKEKVEPVFHIVDIAEQALKELGIEPLIKPIRGGTDGCQLSYKGLPCPNIFAGGHNFHGKYEYVPVESIQKAVDVIVKIAELTAERAK